MGSLVSLYKARESSKFLTIVVGKGRVLAEQLLHVWYSNNSVTYTYRILAIHTCTWNWNEVWIFRLALIKLNRVWILRPLVEKTTFF